MKKRVAKNKKVKSSIKRTTRTQQPESFLHIRRIFIISSCVILFVFSFVLLNRGSVTRSVAGVSIARGLFAQASVQLPAMTSASTYNIYYKQTSDATYRHAVRNIPLDVTTYTISYLKKGAEYQYKISAADATGREFWWSEESPLTNLQPM